jgi:serine-type D-Ala-D-Ala carboxypeptidase (penicillin-binding protein 5/6)
MNDSLRRKLRMRVLGALALAALLVLASCAAAAIRRGTDDRARAYLRGDGTLLHGQGAYRLGNSAPVLLGAQQPVPIASLAKVMTALLVLRALPLPRDSMSGPSVLIRPHDEAEYAKRRTDGQSAVAVRTGERLTERQLLLALLLPSANNAATLLARLAAGSTAAFVRRMNSEARALGMRDTLYTDPSGYDPRTVSTAADQLRLARAAAGNEVFTSLAARTRATLPVAGTVHSTDLLLNTDGFVGTKTGSDDAAGGCFMFRSYRVVHRQVTDMTGVVLGQHGRHPLTAGLYAAKKLVDHVAPLAAGG